jgi:hypothetical protein
MSDISRDIKKLKDLMAPKGTMSIDGKSTHDAPYYIDQDDDTVRVTIDGAYHWCANDLYDLSTLLHTTATYLEWYEKDET